MREARRETDLGKLRGGKFVDLRVRFFYEVQDLVVITLPSWHIFKAGTGKHMIDMQNRCPEDVKSALFKHAEDVCWARGPRSVKSKNRKEECVSSQCKQS